MEYTVTKLVLRLLRWSYRELWQKFSKESVKRRREEKNSNVMNFTSLIIIVHLPYNYSKLMRSIFWLHQASSCGDTTSIPSTYRTYLAIVQPLPPTSNESKASTIRIQSPPKLSKQPAGALLALPQDGLACSGSQAPASCGHDAICLLPQT